MRITEKDIMTPDPTHQSALPEQISAAMDGDAHAADAVARAWKNQASVRADWHAYQLIGDVLRSPDCANPPSRDAALLARVRERLATEPVVLAPLATAAAAATPNKAARWWAPAAVAAGFVAVVGVVIVQPQKEAAQGATVAAVTAGGAAIPPGSAGFQPEGLQPREAQVASASATSSVAAPVMIRSAELDRYLAAHKQFSATSAVPAPGIAVRSVSTVAPSR
jgi:sigma-E factor negative regulatory protein RseA